jgi:hypothetical protein
MVIEKLVLAVRGYCIGDGGSVDVDFRDDALYAPYTRQHRREFWHSVAEIVMHFYSAGIRSGLPCS